MTSENNGMYMPVAPAYGYGNNMANGLFGGSDIWGIILVLLLLGGGMWGGFGGGLGGMMMGNMCGGFGMDYLYPWLNNSEHISGGFRDQQIQSTLTGIQNGITTGFGNVQNALCSGFAGVNAAVNGAQNAMAQQMNANEIASLNRSFAEQTANMQGFNAVQGQLAQCCCDNKSATQDVKYTIATEACNTRAANTANTQAILDKLCQLELDGVRNQLAAAQRENVGLQNQLNMANLAASQTAQTGNIRDAIIGELRSCPIPAQPVYGSQPIFTCGGHNNAGCGCNGNFMN